MLSQRRWYIVMVKLPCAKSLRHFRPFAGEPRPYGIETYVRFQRRCGPPSYTALLGQTNPLVGTRKTSAKGGFEYNIGRPYRIKHLLSARQGVETYKFFVKSDGHRRLPTHTLHLRIVTGLYGLLYGMDAIPGQTIELRDSLVGRKRPVCIKAQRDFRSP